MPFHFLIDHGFDFRLFATEQIGPVTLKQTIAHLREVQFGDQLMIDHKLRGLSTDASRWAFRHRISRRDGKEVAVVEAEGVFFHLTTRKKTAPPSTLAQLISRLVKDQDFEILKDI